MCFICDNSAMKVFSNVSIKRRKEEMFLSKVEKASNKQEIERRKSRLEEMKSLMSVLTRYKLREENCFVLETDSVCKKHKEALISMIQYRWIIPIHKKEKLIEPISVLLKTVLEELEVK